MHFAEALKSAVKSQIFPQSQSLETSVAFDHCKLLREGMDCGFLFILKKIFSFSFFFLKFFFEELVVASWPENIFHFHFKTYNLSSKKPSCKASAFSDKGSTIYFITLCSVLKVCNCPGDVNANSLWKSQIVEICAKQRQDEIVITLKQGIFHYGSGLSESISAGFRAMMWDS